ncbi:disulfide bond formation protein B, partial [Bacillus mojavensis]|nr:disulfide bond formation protein B [Bacillus mojavensis]
FGLVTIPFLALIAFILIIIFMCLLKGEKPE